MMMKSFFRFAVVLLLTLSGLAFAGAEQVAASEKAAIEALITDVQTLKSARFVRNGKEYDSASAAKFLKAKWEANQAKIRTSGDFIEKVATRSSTTGKPYLIRFKDGKEVPCAAYLHSRLRKSGAAASRG